MGVNFLAVISGPPEHGKTSLAVELVADRLRRRYRVFVHDPGHQYTFLPYYSNAAAWSAAAAAAARAKRPLHLGAAVGGSAAELVKLVLGIGRKSNIAARVLVPMFLVLDDAVLLDTSSSSHLSPDDAELLTRRRHLGIELAVLLQWSTQMHPGWKRAATHVYLFRHSVQDLPLLERQLSLKPGELAPLADAPPHRYILVRPGRGVVPPGDTG